MSAGSFQYSKYELNSGDICRIRVQPETLAANVGGVNAAPAGARTLDVTAKTSNGNRSFGIKPRTITVKWTADPPEGYKEGSVVTFPILQEAIWDGIAYGDTGTYQGIAVEVVGKSAEKVK